MTDERDDDLDNEADPEEPVTDAVPTDEQEEPR